MENLISKLKAESQGLLEQYIDKTKTYCVNKFKWAEERKSWSYDNWLELFSVRTGYRIYNHKTKQYEDNITLSKEGHRIRNEVYSITSMGFDKFQEKEIKHAKIHYENSIIKLATRLQKKGVTDEFDVIEQKLGVNFDITIKHPDGKHTRAWTIIAEGPIQRPHYRFLIK